MGRRGERLGERDEKGLGGLGLIPRHQHCLSAQNASCGSFLIGYNAIMALRVVCVDVA